MILTLLWLTVSTPFILSVQKELSKPTASACSDNTSMEEDANPFSGLNEEKSSSSTTFSEYLHEPFHLPTINVPELVHNGSAGVIIYIAHYGELVSPPPEV
ncbi:MAG: hypothetical protein QM802_00150 [Agriterribacter sp.]